jgi:hypothetical protein
MSITNDLQNENDQIIENETALVDAGVIDEDQYSTYREAAPQDVSWLPSDAQ